MNRTTSSCVRYYQPATEYQQDDQCGICISEFAGKEVSVTTCAHNYHTSCLETWLQYGGVCPMCRTPLKDRAIQQECSLVDGLFQVLRFSLQVVDRDGSRSDALHALMATANPTVDREGSRSDALHALMAIGG
ncbi:hypothetical protein J7439_11285 [Salinisphaera sp. G21_0]|nr:RING finger domain-containing protein [Salinisphaera sp. G21_0]MBO9481999.1 hypothetical protein [Salinisphaera sp. G21_0]